MKPRKPYSPWPGRMVVLSRAQMRVYRDLLANEQIDTERLARKTIDALCWADLAYERDSGYLCLSTIGRKSTITNGNQVLLWEPK